MGKKTRKAEREHSQKVKNVYETIKALGELLLGLAAIITAIAQLLQ